MKNFFARAFLKNGENYFCRAFEREDEREYLKAQNILMQAWSPLSAGQNDVFHSEMLCRIGAAHQKSPAQVVLRWLTQRDIVPLVKSFNPQRMHERRFGHF